MPEVISEQIASYLEWWSAAGHSDGVCEAPANWFETAAPPAVVASRQPAEDRRGETASPRAATVAVSAPIVARAAPGAALDGASGEARAAAGSANSLADLHASLEAFNGCGLKATAKNLCLYRGAATARLMLIGEAPGRDEDLAGRPFVGRAGQLLDKMLAVIGIDESNAHITNTVYWRPPGNRTPTPEETTACQPFLQRQMELVGPDVIVLLGGVAAKQVLGLTDGILKLRGQWRSLSVGGREVKALATLHPAYLLRTPAAKRQAWQDLLMIESALSGG